MWTSPTLPNCVLHELAAVDLMAASREDGRAVGVRFRLVLLAARYMHSRYGGSWQRGRGRCVLVWRPEETAQWEQVPWGN